MNQMILGAEIGLTIMGLIALCRGTLSVGKNKVVTGWRARLLGGIAMCTLPLALFIGIVYGIVQAVQPLLDSLKSRPSFESFTGLRSLVC